MRELSVSEVSRNFSAVLDEAEHGETIVVTRSGRRVATIAPAPRGNGCALREVLGRWRGHAAFDEAFAATIAATDAEARLQQKAKGERSSGRGRR
ncbi:prevent-host-death family protein [Halopolyspora algeriensis]|uniref:Antitoxin n=1 Tax=Halopolyspora algeriensis TaxID=1500506 RepID=A0A368VTZ0_9ACTN|nr:type II toxin-antitoxin system prevent-host-death family antitoxin [Halopolyspora algeriensis]RCW45229.1 prevent-host-death family protein [Halopolyspora algeriensis]TQM53052.1 prevent-host-death family protein [Halopolyspora algeriensis]